ncbi:MAG: right-handed parallel beta-helix repeat-containing protein [Alistipes indistinctus]
MAELDSCSHVILRGLTFEESRGSGVLITGGESCLLDGVRISGMGRDGVNIKGGSNHGIRSCLLRQLGFSGIQIEGGDRRTLTPAGHFVENSVVETFRHSNARTNPPFMPRDAAYASRTTGSNTPPRRLCATRVTISGRIQRHPRRSERIGRPGRYRILLQSDLPASSSGTTTGAISAEVPSRAPRACAWTT